jgi:hypothetical protein
MTENKISKSVWDFEARFVVADANEFLMSKKERIIFFYLIIQYITALSKA